MATDFNALRGRLAALRTAQNPTFTATEQPAIVAEALISIAESLTALVGVGGDVLERMGGWERIAGVVELADGRTVEGIIPAEAMLNDAMTKVRNANPIAGPVEDVDGAIEVGSIVGILGEDDGPVVELGDVVAMGVSEGREWLKYDDGLGNVSDKVWADLVVLMPPVVEVTPAPAVTKPKKNKKSKAQPEPPDFTSPEAQEERRLAAEAHMANINTEEKVQYAPTEFEADGMGEFDVPLGIQDAPVVVKNRGKE